MKAIPARTKENRALLEAAGAYLKIIGWTAAVVNVERIQQQTPLSTHFELVIRFTGGKAGLRSGDDR